MKQLPSQRVLCTPYNHALCHFMQSHIRHVHACSCHLRFWPNDWDLLRATAVTRGRNGYRNKSQHGKLTLGKKVLPPLLQGLELGTFQSRVRRSNHWAIPAPHWIPTEGYLDLWERWRCTSGVLQGCWIEGLPRPATAKEWNNWFHRTASSLAAKGRFFEKPESCFVPWVQSAISIRTRLKQC